MKNKQIVFTALQTAELLDRELKEIESGEVLIELEYTVVSGGTERACITAANNTSQNFPTSLGYCGVGILERIGEKVQNFSVGDRVLVYHGIHTSYNLVHYSQLTKVEDDTIDSLEAAFVVIATMGLGGVRKLEVELGESAMVMGLGLLGMFAVQFLAR